MDVASFDKLLDLIWLSDSSHSFRKQCMCKLRPQTRLHEYPQHEHFIFPICNHCFRSNRDMEVAPRSQNQFSHAHRGSNKDAQIFAGRQFSFQILSSKLCPDDNSMHAPSIHNNFSIFHLCHPECPRIATNSLCIKKNVVLVLAFALRVLVDLFRKKVEQTGISAPAQVNLIEMDNEIVCEEFAWLPISGRSLVSRLFLTTGGEEDERGHVLMLESSWNGSPSPCRPCMNGAVEAHRHATVHLDEMRNHGDRA